MGGNMGNMGVVGALCVTALTWRWVAGKMNYFDTFDWFTFSVRKKGTDRAYQSNSLHHNTNFL